MLELTLALPEGAEVSGAALADYERDYVGTALIVDDMDYNRLVAAGLLSSLGFTCTSVASGSEAIACLVTTDYDFAFIDFELPETTGPEILRAALTEKPGMRTKCFAVTAYASADKRRECTEAGFIGFVSKPVSRTRIREALISCGLSASDLASGGYQQDLKDEEGTQFDLEPLLYLAHGSMDRLMVQCDEYLRILRDEVHATLALLNEDDINLTLLSKRLHRLTSHGSIVKARRFMTAIDIVRREARSGNTDAVRSVAHVLEECYRELAINLRRVVDEYRSRA